MESNGVKRRGPYSFLSPVAVPPMSGPSAVKLGGGKGAHFTHRTAMSSSSSKEFNKRVLMMTMFVILLLVAIISPQVVWLRQNSNRKKKIKETGVSKSSKIVGTPAFDSSKLEQKRHQQIRKQSLHEPVQSQSSTIYRNNSLASGHPSKNISIPIYPRLAEFPVWIQNYVKWHAQQRQLYPGMELFQNPKAPKSLIRTCLGICGGLHDRIGQLPWDLYLAAKTNRILLMAWQRPKELEHFLVPNELFQKDDEESKMILDWRVPSEAHFGFADIRTVRNYTQFFHGYPEDHPDDEFWKTQVDLALDRAISGQFAHIKILRHRLLGHLNEGILEDRLRKEGWYEADDIHQPQHLHVAPTFGNIFHLFFRPSSAVHAEIRTVLQTLELSPEQYIAVHCRVRHPKAHEAGSVVKGKNEKYPADKTGLPWSEGNPMREFACRMAATALGCARDILADGQFMTSAQISPMPIYFLADSNDLVRHVSFELQDVNGYLQANKTGIYQSLLTEVQAPPRRRIVARDMTLENAHIDRQKGRDPPAYYGTFIDLYVAMQAKCVVYGIGYYAAFAAKISGTACSYLYAKEAWGSQVSKQAHICPNTHAER